MSTQLTARDVAKAYPGRVLFRGVTFSVRPGERVGIVGENGSGKSTLLRILAGLDRPDAGEVTVRAAGGIGHLNQVTDLPGTALVSDALDGALIDLRTLEKDLRAEERALAEGGGDLARYGELTAAFEARGGYSVDTAIAESLAAVGLDGLARDRELATLSGGERARLALAAVLAADPELLLLDEPTNHLDADALSWLENRLRRQRGTVVVVSHDRVFLERVATALLEVDADAREVRRYGTGYAGYLREAAAARVRWEQAHRAWQEEIAQWTEFARTTAYRVAPGRPIPDHNKCKYHGDGRRVQQSITTRTRGARERLRRLRAAPVPAPPAPLRFTGSPATTGTEFDGPLAELSDVDVPGRLRLEGLTIQPGSRLLVCGPNGAGKTTLLRVLAGELEPRTGTARRAGRVGYLPQESTPADPRRSVLAEFAAGRAGTREEHAEALLGLGLFRTAVLSLPTGMLSVGQYRRLRLARLLTEPVDLLLLDEPTNHFSPVLVEDLEAALDRFGGAAVVVSHDRALRRRFPGPVLDLGAPSPAATR
nr:ABC-F family ATP-binding cassette domain-containing protein [Amycolatopsis anabasis]